jgi:hypothetical protein
MHRRPHIDPPSCWKRALHEQTGAVVAEHDLDKFEWSMPFGLGTRKVNSDYRTAKVQNITACNLHIGNYVILVTFADAIGFSPLVFEAARSKIASYVRRFLSASKLGIGRASRKEIVKQWLASRSANSEINWSRRKYLAAGRARNIQRTLLRVPMLENPEHQNQKIC